jgi:hypothetical protein
VLDASRAAMIKNRKKRKEIMFAKLKMANKFKLQRNI